VSAFDGHAWLASETDWRTFAFGCRCRAVRPRLHAAHTPLFDNLFPRPPDCTPPPV
jgi:hypothetical protein